MKIENEFIPYEQALALKELGFDEECFRCKVIGQEHLYYTPTDYDDFPEQKEKEVLIPTFSQAFRWFREKYNLHHSISILQRSCRYHFKIRTIECESDLKPFGDNKIIFEDGPRKKYEDIELDCLKKLIEIVKDGRS